MPAARTGVALADKEEIEMKKKQSETGVELLQQMTLEEYVFALQLLLRKGDHPALAGVMIPRQANALAEDPKMTEAFCKKAIRRGVLRRDRQGNLYLERTIETLLQLIHESRFCLTLQKDAWIKQEKLVSIYWSNNCFLASIQDNRQNKAVLVLDHSPEAILRYLENDLLEQDPRDAFHRKQWNELLAQSQLPPSKISSGVHLQGTLLDSRRDRIREQYQLLLQKDRLECYRIDGITISRDDEGMEGEAREKFSSLVLRWMKALEHDAPGLSLERSDSLQSDKEGTASGGKWTYHALMADPSFPRSRIGYIGWMLKNSFLALKSASWKSLLFGGLGYALFALFSVIWNLYATCYLNDTFYFSIRSMWGNLTPYLLAGTVDTPSPLKGFQMNWGTVTTEYLVLPLSIFSLLFLRGIFSRIRTAGVTSIFRDLFRIPSLLRSCSAASPRSVRYHIGKGVFYSCIFGFLLYNPFAVALLVPILLLSFAQGEDSSLASFLMMWRTAASAKKVEAQKQKPILFEEILLDVFGLCFGFFLYSILNFVMWHFFDYHIVLRLVVSILFLLLSLVGTGPASPDSGSKKESSSSGARKKQMSRGKLAVFAFCAVLGVAAAVLFFQTGIALADDGGWTESGKTLEGLFANMGFSLILGLSVFVGLLTAGVGLAVAAGIGAATFAGAAVFASTTDYGHRTAEQVVFGRYNDSDPTLLATVTEIGIGIVPFSGNIWGLISGARDLSYDIGHWENTPSNYLNVVLDAFGFVMSGIGLANDLDRLAKHGMDFVDAFGHPSQKQFVESALDENGNLKPNVRYQSGEFEYYYETDELGRICTYETDDLHLTTRTDRLKHNPNTAGKEAGDHAGHLFGDRFGGSADLDNLISQSAHVNQSDYKIIENRWAEALKNNKKVSVRGELVYEGTSMRPSGIQLEYTIDGEFFSEFLPNGN